MSRSVRNLAVKAAVLLLLCCIIPVAVSFMISGNHITNTVTAGYNEIHISEVFGEYSAFEGGKDYEKRVSVKNDGTVPCYVRVFAELEDPGTAEVISIDFNTDDWTEKQDDGFYYYRKVLQVSEETEPLFTTLAVDEDVSEFAMICYSESVQAEGVSDIREAFERFI